MKIKRLWLGIGLFLVFLLKVFSMSAEIPATFLDAKSRAVLALFEEISKIPRCTGSERNFGDWLLQWAKGNNYRAERGNAGNVVIRVPASPGYEKAPVIVLQGHMDMICEKAESSNHDFSKDPIRFKVEEEWLKAEQTTLGADDGIGMALILALAEDHSSKHPPLELLFTTGEETGLWGANALNPSMIRGRILINLDSEEEGVITIGSAGGRMTKIHFEASMKTLPREMEVYALRVEGLQGGHSGVDIHKKLGNAIKIMARTLETVKQKADIRLAELTGGSRINAIPRQAQAIIAFEPERRDAIQEAVNDFEKRIRREYELETAMTVVFAPLESKDKPRAGFSVEDTNRMIAMLLNLPNGVAAMDPRFSEVVETSNNLGTVKSSYEGIDLMSFQRSSNPTALDEHSCKIRTMAWQSGAEASDVSRFEPWQPDIKSDLIARSKEVFQKLYQHQPVLSVVHGGLECSVIAAKYPGLDVIAIGPLIQGAHSPAEKLYLPSVAKVREFLSALLASFNDRP